MFFSVIFVFLAVTVIQEEPCDEAQTQMRPHDCPYMFVGVDETNDDTFPSVRSGQVEEEEDKHFQYEYVEEESVYQLEHPIFIFLQSTTS